MKITQTMATGALAIASVMLLSLTVQAREPEVPQPGSVYELTDEADSAPVNYRSNVDEAYDTEEQHNAEMFAEQFEARRREELIQQRQQLERLDDFAGGRPVGYSTSVRNGFIPY